MIILRYDGGEIVLIEENMCRIIASMRETSPCRILHSTCASHSPFVNMVTT